MERFFQHIGNVYTLSRVNIGQGIVVGIEDEGVTVFLSYFPDCIVEFLSCWRIGFLFSLLEQPLCLFLKVDVLFHQVLKFRLSFAEDRRGESALLVEEVFVFGIEVILRPLCLFIVFGAEVSILRVAIA